MRRFLNCLSILIIYLFSISGFATLELELTQGVDSAMHIAVLPFTGEGAFSFKGGSKFTDVMKSDLLNSGRLSVMDVDEVNAYDVDTKAIDYEYLKMRKIEIVIYGKISKKGDDKVSAVFTVCDVYNKAILFTKEYNVKTSSLRKLSHHIGDVVYEQLTGDRGVFSTKIAYVLVDRQIKKPTKYKLEISDADGYNAHTLLTSYQPLMSPTWSPDGRKIAYVTFEGSRAAICVQDISTGKRNIVAKYPGINGAPAWSPDGKKMALVLTRTGYPKIYILDIKSGALKRITDDWYLDTEPNWAPDGKSIIFTSNRGGGPQIYRIYLDNGKIERVTFKGKYNARASFTPDGKNIVMLHRDGYNFSIAIQNLDNGRHMVLTKSGFDESPSIAPNGKMIVYATLYKGNGVLSEVSVDGKVKLLLPARRGAVQEPAWSPFR